MATKKSGKQAAGGENGGKPYDKDSRCWPGYTPVPGKGEHEQGSCRKEPASKNGGQEVNRETARKKQVFLGGKRAEQAKSKSPDAAERRSVSKAARAEKASGNKAPAKKTAAKKAPAKKTTAKKAAGKKAEAATTPAKRAGTPGRSRRAASKAPARRSPAAKTPRKAVKRTPRKPAARRG